MGLGIGFQEEWIYIYVCITNSASDCVSQAPWGENVKCNNCFSLTKIIQAVN